MIPLHVLCNTDYFADAIAEIKRTKAGDRVGLMSMTYNPLEPLIGELTQAVQEAAARGVQVYLLVDAHSFMVDADNNANGPLLRGTSLAATTHPEFAAKYQALAALAQAGGAYTVINQPKTRLTVPVAGRSHIKTIIVNDTVYIGGCNLSESQQIDCMVKLSNHMLADRLYQLIEQTATDGSVRRALQGQDQRIQVDPKTTVYVDAGMPRQSLIMRQALQLIDDAREHITITCQFFPNSVTASHLLRAHKRGVKVRVFYNHPSHQTSFWSKVQRAVLAAERARLPKALFAHELPADHERIHLKVIATEQGAMIGSHNYVRLGVRLGTAEMAILQRDPTFSEDVLKTILPRL